jgi:hypothetical protein
MNKHLTTLSLAITATAALASAASAQESRGMRFNYAPNIYRQEQPNAPKDLNLAAPSNVHDGAVPHNVLGVDPTFLAKPAPPAPTPARYVPVAPIAQKMTNASPRFGQPVTANPVPAPLAANPIPAAFRAAFGNPLTVNPVVASLPHQPATTAQHAPVKSNAAPSSNHFHHANNVSGKIFKPTLPAGKAAGPAQGLPPIASYGNQGYTPGALMPHVGSGSASASADVSGRLMHH